MVQVGRGGRPTINPFINPNDAKDDYNARQPCDDVENYLGRFSAALEENGYPPDEARAAALTVLPDILAYDRRELAAYPNGRALTDDVFSARFAWLTRGKVTSDGLKPHDDLLTEFPTSARPTCTRPESYSCAAGAALIAAVSVALLALPGQGQGSDPTRRRYTKGVFRVSMEM